VLHALAIGLTVEDRLAIYELVSLHGHLMDAGEFDQLDKLFTEDFVYDLEPAGWRIARRTVIPRRGPLRP